MCGTSMYLCASGKPRENQFDKVFLRAEREIDRRTFQLAVLDQSSGQFYARSRVHPKFGEFSPGLRRPVLDLVEIVQSDVHAGQRSVDLAGQCRVGFLEFLDFGE